MYQCATFQLNVVKFVLYAKHTDQRYKVEHALIPGQKPVVRKFLVMLETLRMKQIFRLMGSNLKSSKRNSQNELRFQFLLHYPSNQHSRKCCHAHDQKFLIFNVDERARERCLGPHEDGRRTTLVAEKQIQGMVLKILYGSFWVTKICDTQPM